jgi:thymidylate kinase
MALLAHDRRALLRRIWRAAAGGAIVITDRYPSETVGAIDSRCFDDATIKRCGRGPKRWLMQWERSLCRGLPRPGLILRLVAPPATAVHRDSRREKEGGPDADAVLRRWEMETRADFGSTPVRPVDTDRPLEASIRDVIRAAWDAL